MELRLLRYFLTVAKEQSFTKAAEQLHITQPTLSRQMASFEENLGITLFIRSGKKITLTDEGILLKRRALEILNLEERTLKELNRKEDVVEGTITIGCGEFAAVETLAKICKTYKEKYPLVQIVLHTATADTVYEIEKAIIQNGARLIILDPIQAYMGDKADMNKANEVRPIFRRLAEVAERTGCAVILIGHLNKAAGGQSAYRGLGSIDFRAAARSVLLIGRVKREPNVRVIIHDKSSLAPEGKPVAFCLDPETGFEWIGEYDITADELLSGAGGNNATKTEQAEKLILDLLADGKELASEDIEKAAADAGISARTVRAAKKNLDGRITSKRIGAAWYHALKK